MSDYVIRARIAVQDDSREGLRSADDGVRRVHSSIVNLGGMLTRVLGGLGASLGLAGLGRGIISLNKEIETANVGMATLLGANYGIGAVQALGMAKSLVGDLRKDAAVGVGELGNYLQGLQTILGPGLATGANLQHLRDLNRNALAAGFAMRGQEGMQLASFDVQQALTGQIGDRTTPIVMQALTAAGITADAFRKLRPEDRIETLNTAFGTFSSGVELMGQTWDAQMGTFMDHLKELARTATGPLFDRWGEQLRRANEWLAQNQATLENIAGRVGDRLLSMWENLNRNASTYVALTAAATAAPMFRGAGAGFMSGAAGAGILERGRQGLARFLFPAMTASTMAGGGLTGAGAGGMALLRSVGGLIGRLAGPLAIVSTLFLAIKGGLTEFQAPTLFLVTAWESLVDGLFKLGDAFGLLTAKGSILNVAGAGLVWILGGVVAGVDAVVRVLATFVVGLATMGRIMGAILTPVLTRDVAATKALPETLSAILYAGRAQIDALRFSGTPRRGQDATGAPETPEARGGGNTIINGDVNLHQTVNTPMGHREIAGAFDLLIERTNRYRSQARRVAVPAV